MSKHSLLTLPLLCLLAACTGLLQVGIEGEPTPDHPATIEALAAENARLATREVLSGDGTPLPPTPPPVPPGLVYRLGHGLYLATGGDAGPTRLSEQADALPSPDGTLALFLEAGDVWVVDLNTGEQRNVTNTPDHVECCPAWWPAQPNSIVFTSRPQSVEPGVDEAGFLTAASIVGADYRILDAEHPAGASPAPSPDGVTIAYGSGLGRLYHWDQGSETFDPGDYGLTSAKALHLASPAWSPDGRLLAWVVAGGLAPGGAYRMGIGVFDLQAMTARLLHPYEPLGSGQWPPAARWSPDGKWVAYVALASEPEQSGLWVLRADGLQEEEYHFPAGRDPVWSPDGRWLAFMDSSVRGAPALRLAELGTWRVREGGLAPDASPVGWLEPGP